MRMELEENKIILERGDMLYRYGLEQNYPDVWSNNIHNPEYDFDRLGHKNQVGAYFFMIMNLLQGVFWKLQ